MAVLGLDHVQLAAPLELGAQQLHVGVEADFAPATKADPGIRVAPEDLDALAARLEAESIPVSWDDSLPGQHRFYSRDPWGNRLEFLAAAPPAAP